MTKHVSPEITGTELTGTDYIRPIAGVDDATMVEEKGKPGWFVNSSHASAKLHAAAPIKIAKEKPKKGLTELKRLEEANAESPVGFDKKYLQRTHAELLDMDERDDERDEYEQERTSHIGRYGRVISDAVPGNFARKPRGRNSEEVIRRRPRKRKRTTYTRISTAPWQDFLIVAPPMTFIPHRCACAMLERACGYFSPHGRKPVTGIANQERLASRSAG